MVDGGSGAAFPVIFYDGEREINIGDIRVQPLLEFKIFQMMISQRIGISPNQISIYLVHHSSLPEERRKTPITGKVNFALIIRQKDCFFLVILKRSRKSRFRKLRPNSVDFCDYLSDNDFLPSPPPENVVLLRRNQPEMNMMQLNCFGKPFYDQINQVELAGLNDRLQNLKVQRENYGIAVPQQTVNLISQSLAPRPMPPNLNPVSDNPGPFPKIQETMTKSVKASSTASNKVVCEECVSAEKAGCSAPFHPCVSDPLISPFLTRVGPIARPVKSYPVKAPLLK